MARLTFSTLRHLLTSFLSKNSLSRASLIGRPSSSIQLLLGLFDVRAHRRRFSYFGSALPRNGVFIHDASWFGDLLTGVSDLE